MGASESKPSDTINWNNVKTNEFSSNIANIKNISQEANQLIENLNIPQFDDTLSSEINLDNIFENHKISNSKNKKFSIDNSDITSSPFITSEMYNYIVNKYNNNKNTNKNTNKINNKIQMMGGGDDLSSTPSTSSNSISDSDLISSDSESDSSNKKKKLKSKKNKKNEHKKNEHKNEHKNKISKNQKKSNKKSNKKASIQSTDSLNLSYISSSAHTGGGYTENSSINNENNLQSSSVNTNDINMISE
jgi:hypothetical protein